METSRGHIPADFLGRPVLARISAILEYFQLDVRRMIKADKFLSEPLLNTAVLHFVAVQVFQPEFQRAFRNSVCGSLNLTGTLTAFHASIREGGVHRARLGIRIGIIEMIVGITAIEENSLLNHALAKNLCLEVDIFLRSAYTHRHVVETFYKRHGAPPARKCITNGFAGNSGQNRIEGVRERIESRNRKAKNDD